MIKSIQQFQEKGVKIYAIQQIIMSGILIHIVYNVDIK